MSATIILDPETPVIQLMTTAQELNCTIHQMDGIGLHLRTSNGTLIRLILETPNTVHELVSNLEDAPHG